MTRHLIRLVNLIIILSVVSGVAFLYNLTPDPSGMGTHKQLLRLPCLFQVVLKVPCPSCGLTTSWTYLVQGNPVDSFKAHPLGPIFFSIVVFIGISSIWGFIKNRSWWSVMEKRWFQNIILCGIGLYLVVWIIRLI